jgi:exodeoxyribonuclease V beta subunit
MLSLLPQSRTSAGGETRTALVRRRHRYALIDEFQDTDEIQWSIFSHLFLGTGPDHGLVVIGDPKQAIYGFRGADLDTYLEAKTAIVRRGGEVVPLVQNFRQTPELVAVLNDLFRSDRSPSFFTGAVAYDHPVVPGGAKVEAITAEGRSLTPIRILELVPDHGPISPTFAKEALAEKIASEVQALLLGATRIVERGVEKRIRPKDIFVLTRSGREGRQIARRLAAHRVPAAFYQQEGLFETHEAADVLAVLEAVELPRDRQRVARALKTPFFAVPLAELDRAAALGEAHPYHRALERWHDLAKARRHGELYARILAESGIVERELLLAESDRALTNYLHLFEILEAEAGRASHAPSSEIVAALASFIAGRRSPSTEADVQRQNEIEDAVQVMTMHKAKGLEAAVVFLFGGIEAGPAGARVWHEGGARLIHVGEGPPAAAEIEAQEEDQRLLYVALTRAKARVYVPYFSALESGERVVRKLEGPYRHLVAVLDPIVAAMKGGGGPSGIDLDEVRELPRRPPKSVAPEPRDLSLWRPSPELLAPPANDPRFGELRSARAPVIVTSYSRIKASADEDQPLVVGFDVHTELPPEQLPAGAESGKFLHEILERVPLPLLAACETFEAFAESEVVKGIVGAAAARYRRDPLHLPHATRLAFDALTRPVGLGDTTLARGFGRADEVARELEFLYPIPEADHPPLGKLGPVKIERGFIKGFIDLVFVEAGKVYVLDWKSDLLPSYEPAPIAAHVGDHYRIQAELYTLAVAKLYGMADEATFASRFGGVVYAFVRGMSEPDRGVYFERPTWQSVVASELGLRTARLGGPK